MTPKTATGPILWYMNLFGFKGLFTPWKQIYVKAGYEDVEWLLRHERKHLEQLERDGWWMFHLKYFYWTLRYGYWNNPYEFEARIAERTENAGR